MTNAVTTATNHMRSRGICSSSHRGKEPRESARCGPAICPSLSMARSEDRGVGGLGYVGDQRIELARDEILNGRYTRTKFLCPGCNRGCRMLHAQGRTWICRTCSGFDYSCRYKGRWRPALPVCNPFGGGSSLAIRCTSGASASFAMRRLRSKTTWQKVSTTSLFD